MPKKKANRSPAPALRQQAEERVAEARRRAPAVSDKSAYALEHELRVHQAELEVQNENLREMQLWLAEARDRYLDLFEFAPVAYLSLGMDQVIREANLTATALLMVDRQKLIGAKLAKWVAKDHCDAWHRHLQAAQSSECRETCELPMVRGDGSRFIGHLEIVPVMSHQPEEVSGWRVTISDFTERKQAEEELTRAKAAAEKANLAKSRFLANVSHELRTPMSAILGMTQLALNEELSPAVRDYLETVMQSSGSLLELLNDLLDFARIEEGRVELESAHFSLRSVVEQAVKSLAARAREKGLELNAEVAADVPDDLLGDPFRLRQVLMNLVGNAIKFTHKGSVGVDVQAQSQGPEDVGLQFAVTDTGIGISPQEQEKIFSPFTQADASTTRCFGGTGLGLSISADLVRLMGGRMWLKSRLDAGSTFHFTVRLKKAPAAAPGDSKIRVDAAHELAARPAARQLHVLVAEDVPPNRKLVATILRMRGHVVALANDGHEAVEAAAHNQFDVILLDVQMPVVDGFQAAVAIRKMAGERQRAPLVAMTAYAMKGDVERCITAGFDDYLGKPFTAEELIQKVEQMADRGAAAAPAGEPEAAPKRRAGRGARTTRVDQPHDDQYYVEAIRKRCFDDAMFDDMVNFFFQESPQLLEQLRIACQAGNGPELVRAAHRLKSTVMYLGTPAASQAVARVEELGLSGKLRGVRQAIGHLEAEMERMKTALAPHRQQQQQA